jgi:hypothetical protein
MHRTTVAKAAAYTIAGIAAVSSYGHQVLLLEMADLDPLFGLVPSEWITPLTVDSLAMIGLMVRMSETVTESTKRWAMLPLVLAGGLAIAANVATARNIVQIVVGVWTVLAYIVAEIFVSKMERKSVAPATAAKPKGAKMTEAEKAARKRAGYSKLDRAAKAEWTKRYRARTSATAPTSPGHGPVSAPSAAELEDAVR